MLLTFPSAVHAATPIASLTVQAQSTSVMLAWDANPASENVSGYLVGYRTSAGSETLVQVGSALTGTVTGLTPGNTYLFRVYAVNTNGRSDPSNEVSKALAPPPDTEAPSAPVSLTATAASPSQINLSWAASTDNVAVTVYAILHNQLPLITLPGTQTTYTHVGLAAGSTHSYTVQAEDAAGNLSVESPIAMATTLPVVAPKPCMVNGKPYAITIAVQSYSKQVALGGRGLVALTLANSFPVTKLQIKLGAQVVGEIVGQELRDITGAGFSVPRTAGTYHLFLTATDNANCETTTTFVRPLVVQ